jgi:predicted O-methyltransferase YrrM
VKAQNAHGLHSPFVYDLYKNVISTHQQFYFFMNAEVLRNKLLNDQRKIVKKEFGTGSNNGKEISISIIAKSALKSSKEAQFLFKLTNYLNYKNILEIGTSLGLTTAYLAAANSNSTVVTIEGCENTLSVAKENLNKLHIKNCITLQGDFKNVLKEALDNFKQVDFVFFDGNHQYEPTINYFHQCLLKSHNDSVFIFDDIYWSKGMTKAWEEIKNHEAVTVSIDLFKLGLVFFRKQQAKQHFILRF